ncbi:hypothetical protein Scep_014414 [Stephania cephalantha]|uniref:Uncharacterized protein n=1 Tax=Stephania cephalantha TaxID=152367 RepID=A0AAP0J335_9MAGN
MKTVACLSPDCLTLSSLSIISLSCLWSLVSLARLDWRTKKSKTEIVRGTSIKGEHRISI